MSQASSRPRIRRRRIVERPRLAHVLDRSRARVRTLVAGPGYGKTVLLEQWAPTDGRRLGWYRARRSAVDVAVVARGLQAAAAPILPVAGRRMLERLSVTDDPEREAVLLGEMLAEDLEGWPEDSWIVVDDYHHLAATEASERFVEVLVQRSPLQLVIASRVRPVWVHAKALLYGDVLEITQSMLAMTIEEAEQVLEGGRLDLSSGLLTLAEGWPAVIGLAGMAPDVTEIDADMPETLYDFFAEELYRGLDPDLAAGLGILAAMPSVDRELASVLLGTEQATTVCDEALALGIMDERDGRLELELASPVSGDSREASAKAVRVFVEKRDWESTLELLAVANDERVLTGFLDSAIDDLARGGQLRAVEGWLTFAREAGVASAETALAEAEINLRHGRHLTALTAARGLVAREFRGDPHLGFRTLISGARAAHIGSLEEEALQFYERALEAATDPRSRREARWGQLMCLSALERTESHDLLEELAASTAPDDPVDLVRLVDKQFSVGFRFGVVHNVSDGHRVAELVTQIDDPLVRLSFRSMFAWALVLSAYFDDSRMQAELLLSEALEYRVDPALPYGYSNLAASLAGQRSYPAALAAIEESSRYASRMHDENGIQNAYAIRTRILLQAGEVVEACATEPPDLGRALPSMRGEVLGSRALALASLGQLRDAERLIDEARSSTLGVEARHLATAAECVVCIKARRGDAIERCTAAIRGAFETGALEPLVTAYRCNKDLLSALRATPAVRDLLVYLLRRAADEDLAVGLGYAASDLLDPIESLTARERDVHDLVCQGLSNAEVARILFISVTTVKAHLHRIYRKCGVHSRAALIHNASRRLGSIDSGGG